jgi:delta14-sterol reductase
MPPSLSLAALPLAHLAAGTLAYAAFFAALLLAARVLPGERVLGFPQPDGQRKSYTLNGLALFVLTHFVVIAGTLVAGGSLAPLVTTWFWPLLAGANVFAVVWALALYVGGRARTRAPGRGFVRDFWMGVELNPTWHDVDLKVFAYQPSLIGLGLLVAGFGYAQYEAIGSLTPQMLLYQAFWWLYLYTHYRDEAGVLSMYDVIAERFGFMLVWGDLVLVPFFYCMAGWWLLDQREPASWPVLLALTAAYALGLWVFRGANKQKHRFKVDPDARIWGESPRLLGGRLLVSGWWGVGRKINYFGELTLYFAIASLAGWGHIGPFLVPLWLLGLLVHRAWRDEQRCRAKYGPLWEEYCRVVPARILPLPTRRNLQRLAGAARRALP